MERAAIGESCLVFCLLLAGCPSQELAPLEPCVVSGLKQDVPLSPVDKVDLLFVVDDSGSMREEQANLALQLPRFVQALVTGDHDGDGVPEHSPARDVHLGVVSTNMGDHGAGSGSCAQSLDGVLQAVAAPDCTPLDSAVPYLQYAPDAAAPAGPAADGSPAAGASSAQALGEAFGCIARLGDQGCGHEQPLEAALKALTASTSATSFANGAAGQADAANRGFLREDSVLAVVLITDEDDCSAPLQSAALFDVGSSGPLAATPINLRCGTHPGMLHPVARFVEGLRSLRMEEPAKLIFGAIVGIPDGLSGEAPATVLAHPGMVFSATVNADNTPVPAPACQSAAGDAAAARRIVEVAAGFETAIVHSICADDFRPALADLSDKIGDQLSGACLQRTLDREGQRVPCNVLELLAPGEVCDAARGREPTGADVEGGVECRVVQVPVSGSTLGEGVGWYYDDFSQERVAICQAGQPRIAFTDGAGPEGTQLSFHCLQPLRGHSEMPTGIDAIGLACPPEGCGAYSEADLQLTCDPVRETCQLACTQDAQCPKTWACAPMEGGSYCVNPRCPSS